MSEEWVSVTIPEGMSVPVSKQSPQKPLIVLCDYTRAPSNEISLVVLDDVTRDATCTHAQRMGHWMWAPFQASAVSHGGADATLRVSAITIAELFDHPPSTVKSWVCISDRVQRIRRVMKADLGLGNTVALNGIHDDDVPDNEHRVLVLKITQYPEVYTISPCGGVAYIPDLVTAQHVAEKLDNVEEHAFVCRMHPVRRRWTPVC